MSPGVIALINLFAHSAGLTVSSRASSRRRCAWRGGGTLEDSQSEVGQTLFVAGEVARSACRKGQALGHAFDLPPAGDAASA